MTLKELQELQEQVLQMQEQLNNITTEKQNLENTVNELTKDKENLQTLNQKLFLKVTSAQKEEEEEKEEIPFFIDEDTFKMLSNKEKELLKEIEMGDDE